MRNLTTGIPGDICIKIPLPLATARRPEAPWQGEFMGGSLTHTGVTMEDEHVRGFLEPGSLRELYDGRWSRNKLN